MEEKILVQDGDNSVLEVLTLALEAEGFNVIPVSKCDDEILGLIDYFRPHVVILDYRLSGENCIEICHRIKRKYPHLPVIALSCNVNIHEQYAQKGFDAYIQKPFDLGLLYRILHDHLPETSIPLDKKTGHHRLQ